MIDTETFFQQALNTARSNLPYANGDASRAVQTALQEAHVAMGQREFFEAIDALGGDEELRQRLINAL